MTKYILLTGYARSGKDTVAGMLQVILERDYKISVGIQALAEPIKAIANIATNGEAGVDTTADRGREMSIGYTPRKLWQIIGTELFQHGLMKYSKEFKRIIGKTLWCRILHQKANEVKLGKFADGIVIVTDVRFPHEVEYFQSISDAVVVHVSKFTIPWYKRIFLHRSERYIHKLHKDLVIDNRGTLQNLKGHCYEVAGNLAVWYDEMNEGMTSYSGTYRGQ